MKLPHLPWLMASFAVFAQGYVYSTLLTARGDLKLLNRLALGAVANVAGNAWWLSRLTAQTQPWGVPSSALTQVLVVGLQTACACAFTPEELVESGANRALAFSGLRCNMWGVFTLVKHLRMDGGSVPRLLHCCWRSSRHRPNQRPPAIAIG